MDYERGINVTVRDLRECLEGLPDDMDVIIPIIDEEDANHIYCYRHVRTIGILENFFEPKPALCLNAAANGLDLHSQVGDNENSTKCTKVLF